ncbi:hypothetical protein ACIA6D_08280 [Streptomyces cacaoi]|uniref:hypothetical protein n=1 Tax=Streptomyces cacaoi TaxID=1898 RepID=UPI003747C1FC
MPLHSPRSLTVQWGSDSVLVSNIEPTLPGSPGERDIAKVVEAGNANPATPLPDAAWQAVARSTTGPDGLAVQLRSTEEEPNGLLMVENVEGATLRSVVTRVRLNEMLPGIQPRTGMEVMEIADPQVQGITSEGRPCAVIGYRYKDLQHLRDHMWQTIHGTLSLNSYAVSILARGVTRNVITHPVEITFEDGTDPLYSLVVRDGITRMASSWAVLAGPGAEPAEAATLAVDSLLGKPGAAPTTGSSPLGERLAASRERWRQGLREEFAQEMAAPEPGVRAAQIAQTFVLPAQIAVGAEGHPDHLLASEDIFDDAIRSVLASVHVEFKQWDTAAQNVEVATRALKRVIQLGDAQVRKSDLQVVYGLAVGRITVEELPQVFAGDPPGTALWRGVYLVHALSRPELLERLKDQAKAIKGGRRMGLKGFAELLGPLIDLPWRSRKKLVTAQARNAWNNGGVLTADVVGEWEPHPTDDFTSLVAPALAGDIDARCTLAVAGGMALIADKLLTRNVGSALSAPREKGGVPFRADVSLVIEGLSEEGNELGLWTLALAANRFRSDDLPENAVTMRQLTRKEKSQDGTDTPYVHFKVDLEAEDKIARDADGVPVTLHQWDVVWASDPARALKAHPPRTVVVPQQYVPVPPEPGATGTSTGLGAGVAATEGTGTEQTGAADHGSDTNQADSTRSPWGAVPPPLLSRPASQRAADHRHMLRQSVTAARDALDHLHALEPEVGGHTPIVPLSVLDELHELLIGLQTDVENLRRRTVRGGEPSAEGEETDEESQEAAGV